MNRKMKKTGMIAAFCFVLSAAPVLKTKAMDEIWRKPALSGTTQTWIYEGEIFDEKESRNRVFADDLEDGDLTFEILESTEKAAMQDPGDYKVTYEVTDRDGNRTQMETLVKVISREDDSEKTIQRKLYTIADAWYLTDISFDRGYYHDRQSLGIWLPAHAALEIRLVNAEEFGRNLEIDFMNQDSATESSAVIPATGEFVTVQNTFIRDGVEGSRDSVPFIETPKGTSVCPIIEFKWNDSLQEIPYYRYKDDQDAFFEKWRSTEAPYAILEGSAATFLAPRKDMDEIIGASCATNPAYRFSSIDEMLEWYAAFVEQYDAYAGLDFYAEEPYNQNIRAKFFIKANESGAGQAYYIQDHSAYNGDSLNLYLSKSWLSLHEFGHGYEGKIAQREHPFVETTNNIMGYYFEPTYRAEDDFGWLLGNYYGTKAERIAMLEQKALNRRKETMSFSGIVAGAGNYDVSLYMFTNILDKLGPQKTVSAMHTLYRRKYYETKKQSASSDVIVESFSRSSGYNVIPYFESWHVIPSDRMEDQMYQKDYPMLYYLKELIPDPAKAVQVQKKLGLDGVYSLVSTDELADTGYKSRVKLKIQIDAFEQIRGRNIRIKNGTKVVKTITLTDHTVNLELPVGIYEVELPAPRTQNYQYDNAYLIASEGQVEKELCYEGNGGNLLADDIQIRLLGMSDRLIASIGFDTSRQKLIWKSEKVTPHSYFDDIYASVRILDKDGREIFADSFYGTKMTEEAYREIDFSEGARIEIFHREPWMRLQFSSSYTGEQILSYSFSGEEQNSSYVMTSQGIMKEKWDEGQRRKAYFAALEQYSDFVKQHATETMLADPESFHNEKLLLKMSYLTLTEEEKEDYRQKWGSLIGEEPEIRICYRDIPSYLLNGSADSESGVGTDGLAGAAVDGDISTYWHSNYGNGVRPDIPGNRNNSYTILLPEAMNVGKIAYIPRQSGTNGRILGFELYYSTTAEGENFEKLSVKNDSWSDDYRIKEVEFDAPMARRLRIRAMATAGNPADTFISAAEFYLYERYEVNTDVQKVFLDQLHREYDQTEKMIPKKNRNGRGGQILLQTGGRDRAYTRGIGLLGDTSVTYDLRGKHFEAFSAVIGVEKTEAAGKEAQLQIYGDGALLFESGCLDSHSDAEPVYLPIKDVEKLQFTVTGTDGDTAVTIADGRFYPAQSHTDFDLKVGEKIRIVDSSGSTSDDGTMYFETENEQVAAVDEYGNVTGIGAGVTVIRSKGVSGLVEYTIRVSDVPVSQLVLDKTELNLKKGESAVLFASVMPEFATDQSVTWKSNNEAAVVVDQAGKVTAVSAGNAVITAYSADGTEAGSVKASCIVTVTEPSENNPLPDPPGQPEEPEKPTKPVIIKVKKPAAVKGLSVKLKKRQAVLTWKKTARAEGYEIWMRTGNGKYKKIKTVSAKTRTIKTKRLRAKKKYTFRVRAYRKDAAGKKVYGEYSGTKKVLVK